MTMNRKCHQPQPFQQTGDTFTKDAEEDANDRNK